MGRLLNSAIDRAGLADIAARVLAGQGVSESDLVRLRAADVLILAGLADAVRARHRGDEVRLLGLDAARRMPDVVRVELTPGGAEGATGQELLREIALARLTAGADKSIAVSYEQIGIELAQTALAFGADALIGDLSTKRTLPLLDGPAARREEITGLIERAGRKARFVEDANDANAVSMESRS